MTPSLKQQKAIDRLRAHLEAHPEQKPKVRDIWCRIFGPDPDPVLHPVNESQDAQ